MIPVKKVCVSLGMWLFLVKLNAPINVAMHDSNERRTQNITTGQFKTCNIEGRSLLYMSTLLACGTKKAYWRTVGGQNNRYVRNACRRAPPLPLMSMLIVGVDRRKDKIIDTQRTRIWLALNIEMRGRGMNGWNGRRLHVFSNRLFCPPTESHVSTQLI